MKENGKKITLPLFIFIQSAVCLYTVSDIAAKFASGYEFMSWGFIVCYGIEILILGIYAVLWQQILKKADISTAYANRSIAIFYSMVWAALIFKESITVKNLCGVVLVFFGTWMVNRDE